MSLRRVTALVPVFVALACDLGSARGRCARDAGELPRADPDVLYAIGAVLAEQVKDVSARRGGSARGRARLDRRRARHSPLRRCAAKRWAAKVSEFHERRA